MSVTTVAALPRLSLLQTVTDAFAFLLRERRRCVPSVVVFSAIFGLLQALLVHVPFPDLRLALGCLAYLAVGVCLAYVWCRLILFDPNGAAAAQLSNVGIDQFIVQVVCKPSQRTAGDLRVVGEMLVCFTSKFPPGRALVQGSPEYGDDGDHVVDRNAHSLCRLERAGVRRVREDLVELFNVSDHHVMA